MAQFETIQKTKRAGSMLWLIQATRTIRKKITAKSGRWDAAKIIRQIRYAK